MLRRRGIVSQSESGEASIGAPVAIKRPRKDESDSDSELSSSVTSSESSGASPKIHPYASGTEHGDTNQTSMISTDHVNVLPIDGEATVVEKKTKGKGKGKRDYSDESKWKKIRVEGSEKEVMVDVSRIQKYVDYDAVGVESFQKEVESAKGNFRQQTIADYSDL